MPGPYLLFPDHAHLVLQPYSSEQVSYRVVLGEALCGPLSHKRAPTLLSHEANRQPAALALSQQASSALHEESPSQSSITQKQCTMM